MPGCLLLKTNFSYLWSKYQNLFIIGPLLSYLCSLFWFGLENVEINFYLLETLAFFPFQRSFSYPTCLLQGLKVHQAYFKKPQKSSICFLNNFIYPFLFSRDLHLLFFPVFIFWVLNEYHWHFLVFHLSAFYNLDYKKH